MGSGWSSISVVGGVVFALNGVADTIVRVANWVGEQCIGFMYYRVIIQPSNGGTLCRRAIVEEIKSAGVLQLLDTIHMKDGHHGKADNSVSNGNYELIESTTRARLSVSIEDEKIILRTRKYLNGAVSNVTIPNELNRWFEKHNTSSVTIQFYLPDPTKNDWTMPVYRAPRSIHKEAVTADMQRILTDVEQFVHPKTEYEYEAKSFAYRRGYFLWGATGCGKSRLVELIAQRFNRPVYQISLNADNMTDVVLHNLCRSVAFESILLFDEFDKQLIGVRQNKDRVHVTMGGLNTAIDGPERLPHGCIVVIVGNTNPTDYLTTHELAELCRPGRIDVCFEMH